MGTSTIMFDRLVPPGGEFKPRTRVRIRLVAADDGEGVGFNATDRRTILGLADQLLVASELFVIDLTAQDYIDAPENTVYEVQRVYPKSPAPPVETFSVPIEPAPTTTTSALTLPVTTIPVDSTESFTASGVVYLAGEIVEYAGKTSTTLTGCTGGAGPVASGEAVRQAHWIPDYLVNPPVGLPNLHVDDAIGAHAASAVAVAPTGGLVATDAQAALAELDSDLAAEAALARNADNLTSGTVADARIAASIARDSEVTAAVAAEAALRETGDTTRSANQQVANYTLVLSDAGKAVEGNAAGALNFTVPPNSSVAYPTGTIIEVVQVGAGAVSLAQGSGVTITGDTVTPGQGGSLLLRKTGTNAWFSAIASVRSGTFVPSAGNATVTGVKDFTTDAGLKYKGETVARVNEGPLSLNDPRVNGDVALAFSMLPTTGGQVHVPLSVAGWDLPTTAIELRNGDALIGEGSQSRLNGKRTDGGPAFTTATSAKRIRLEHFQYAGAVGSGDFLETGTGFGGIQLNDLHVSPVGRGVDLGAGSGIDIQMQNVRVNGGTGAFYFLCALPVNSVVCINCYADGALASPTGFQTSNCTAVLIGCASDNHTQSGYSLGGRLTAIGPTAENNAIRGFFMAASGSSRISLLGPKTFNQLVPYEIAGSNSVLLDMPESASTPSGFSLVLTGGATGYNRLFGNTGALDGGISKNAAARLIQVASGMVNVDDVTLRRSAANIMDLEIGTVIGAQMSEAADGQTALLLRRNVGGTLSLQRVTMGAADSGGAGFKVLRVAN